MIKFKILIGVLLIFAIVGCSRSPEPELEITVSAQSVSVAFGPTTIPHGDALGASAITIRNEFFAVAFAVDTPSPWGVAAGGILDIGIVRAGVVEGDIAALVDFMPNNWSAWPSAHQSVELETNTPELVVVLVQRDWGEVELETRFEIRAGSNLIRLHTRMVNNGKLALPDLLSGYVMWQNLGFDYGMPGFASSVVAPDDAALGDWSALYDRNWALGLHAAFSTHLSYTGRDRYRQHSLEPAAVEEFEAWLQIEDSANLVAFVQTEIDSRDLPSGRVYGGVSDAEGGVVADSAVVVSSGGEPYAWALADEQGQYEMALPTGDYQLYATAAGYANGTPRAISVDNGVELELSFADMGKPATITFKIVDRETEQSLDARIAIEKGNKPLIRYFGEKIFYTELERPGIVEVVMAAGEYEFSVSAGGGFTSRVLHVPLTLTAGEKMEKTVTVPVLVAPQQRGWYSADLHHHSDVLDGLTAPGFVLRSELAAGIDIAALTDHDSTVNNAEMGRLAASRGMPFIAGMEISPSWAHFNAYPIDADKTIGIDVGQAPVQDIFAEARRLGAEVIHVNHPYGNYGYFGSLEKEVIRDGLIGSAVPGDYDAGFDLVEITPLHIPQTLNRTWQLWNIGKPAYFAAGSDVHDVWDATEDVSGAARSYVYLAGEVTADSFITSLKAGHGYASQGPLIYPELMFGSELTHSVGAELKLVYQVQSVHGLASVRLIEKGVEVQSLMLDTSGSGVIDVKFEVKPEADTWFSLVVEDAAGKYAYSNPLWVKVDGEGS
ncbi:MAG: hypothetical protein ACI9GW_002330 [Halieaceae bacterium]|jgi:hypothetical protein